MSEPTDQHLLHEWAAHGCEAAFRSLLRRHGGFVYGAALRRAGDAGLAEEITQDVFARLAQNARRLISHPTLAGWLHRTTMLITLDRIRRMTRGARKLAGLSTMNQNARDRWEEILPHLDKALDSLGPREREVVMLHFIERQTFPEIARVIGGTPDGARMRANRALASLARLLGKKGSTVAVATLATGLGAAATHAMPASIAALTPQALAGMGKVSVLSFLIHSIQTMKTAKTAAAIALALALATPLVIQQGEIAAAEARIAKLQQQAGGPQGKAAAQPSAPALAAGAGAGIDLRQLGDDALEEGSLAKRRIRIAVARLDTNNLTGLIETVLHGGMMVTKREALLEALLRELRSRDEAQFLAWTMKVYAALFPDGVVGTQSMNCAYGFRSGAVDAFREWVAVKPAEAAAWAEANREAWAGFARGPGIRPTPLDILTTAGLLKSDPERAYATLDKRPLSFCLATFDEAGRSLSETQLATFTQWAAALPDVEKRRRITREAVRYAPVETPNEGKLERLDRVLRGLQMNEEDTTWIAMRLVLDSVWRVEDDLSKVPKAELEWVEKNIAPARQDYVKGALGHLFVPKQALIFLGQQLDASPNDDLIAGYVESEDMRWHPPGIDSVKDGRHGETAFKLAMRTSDPARRSELLVRAWTDLHKDSATAARQILEIPELSAEDRAALETRIAPLLEKNP